MPACSAHYVFRKVYAKLQPLRDMINATFWLSWSWTEVLVFLSFVNNIKSVSDTEGAVVELLEVPTLLVSTMLRNKAKNRALTL